MQRDSLSWLMPILSMRELYESCLIKRSPVLSIARFWSTTCPCSESFRCISPSKISNENFSMVGRCKQVMSCGAHFSALSERSRTQPSSVPRTWISVLSSAAAWSKRMVPLSLSSLWILQSSLRSPKRLLWRCQFLHYCLLWWFLSAALEAYLSAYRYIRLAPEEPQTDLPLWYWLLTSIKLELGRLDHH